MKRKAPDGVPLNGEQLPLPDDSASAALILVSILAVALRHALTALAHYCDDGTQRGARVAIILREIVSHTAAIKPNPWTKVVDAGVRNAHARIERLEGRQ